MKKSEKLFLAINEIDDKIIEEAKSGEQEAVRIKVKKHMPIKEIMAFAACFAVLAGAVFGIVRYKLSHELSPTPDNSNSSLSSAVISDTVSNTESNSDVKLVFTEEDIELQNILKELSPGKELRNRFIYRIFGESGLSEQYFKFEYDPEFDGTYILTPRGNSQSGLMYPQTREELYKLLLKYFTFRAANSFMDEVEVVSKSENPDGTFTIGSIIDASRPTFFIAADGIYCKKSETAPIVSDSRQSVWNYAKVVSKTDDTIIFTYLPYPTYPEFDENGNPVYPELENYDENALKGVLKYERGDWRLDLTREGFDLENDLPVMVKDEEFPDIMQTYMEQGSFNDKLRHIILTASSVEGLESSVRALDTENRISRILVTEYSDDPQYYKIGKPVTSGSIEPGKTAYINVFYNNNSDGVVCWYGRWIDSWNGELNDPDALSNKINLYIMIADTAEELKALIHLGDVNERITAVRIYRNLGEGRREEITSGELDTGMTVYVKYDGNSYQEFAKTSFVTLT